MSIQRSPRVDRLVVDGDVGPVASVLCAAAAPAHREELAGEDAAVAAFRTAEVPVPRGRSVFRTAIAKALTLKAVIVVAVAGSTGVVLAASEGAAPAPSYRPAELPTTAEPNPPAGSRPPAPANPPAVEPAVTGAAEKGDRRRGPKPPPAGTRGEKEPPAHGRPAARGNPGKASPQKQKPAANARGAAAHTPVGDAPGAAHAVPQSGAEPPSRGG